MSNATSGSNFLALVAGLVVILSWSFFASFVVVLSGTVPQIWLGLVQQNLLLTWLPVMAIVTRAVDHRDIWSIKMIFVGFLPLSIVAHGFSVAPLWMPNFVPAPGGLSIVVLVGLSVLWVGSIFRSRMVPGRVGPRPKRQGRVCSFLAFCFTGLLVGIAIVLLFVATLEYPLFNAYAFFATVFVFSLRLIPSAYLMLRVWVGATFNGVERFFGFCMGNVLFGVGLGMTILQLNSDAAEYAVFAIILNFVMNACDLFTAFAYIVVPSYCDEPDQNHLIQHPGATVTSTPQAPVYAYQPIQQPAQQAPQQPGIYAPVYQGEFAKK